MTAPTAKKNVYLLFIFCSAFTTIDINAQTSSNATNKIFQDKLSSGGLGPVMTFVPAGKFVMGDLKQVGQSYEHPAHEVTFSEAFHIGKFPITFNEYDRYSKATGQTPVSDYHWGRNDRPIINVNLDDARAYASWLSAETGYTYRLPSEAEWEYAARAGANSIYPWGNDIGKNNANCNGCGSIWDGNKTAPVGQFPANAWGLHDMQGNTWDLTEDCWNFNYRNAPTNGSPWKTGDCIRGVIRGGSLGDTPQDLRLSTRLRNYSATRTVIIGFRLVREL